MKTKTVLISLAVLLLAAPVFARGKKHANRAMIEKMEAVPCGAKERGLTGLGSVFASVGATHVDSTEKLCPQYMIRSDEMEYHIRPLDKHPRLLPVGQEGEFKISKDVLEMKIPDGDHKKRRYQVVAMKPVEHPDIAPASYQPRQSNYSDKSLTEKTTTQQRTTEVRNPGTPPSPPQ